MSVAAGDADGRRRPPDVVGAERRRDAQRRRGLDLRRRSKAVTVAIGRGENNGKTITYHNVARHWIKLGAWNGKAKTWSVPIHELGDGVDEAAVMVQSGTVEKPKAMLGGTLAALH